MEFKETFKLLTGREVVAHLITADLQDEFVTALQKGKSPASEFIKKAIISIDGKENPSEEAIMSLTQNEVEHLLILLRIASYDPDMRVVLDWEGLPVKKPQTVAITEDAFMIENAVPFDDEVTRVSDTEYDMVLPVSKKKVRLSILTLKKAEAYSQSMQGSKKATSINNFIKMRTPRLVTIDEKSQKERLVGFNFGSLIGRDVEALRKAIFRYEGRITGSLQVKHPTQNIYKEIDPRQFGGFLIPTI